MNENEQVRLWGKIIRKHRIDKSLVVPIEDEDVMEALRELCRHFDLQCPILLPKHEKEFDEFGRTQFLPEHFMEKVDFQRLEVELIQPEAKKKTHPRNPLTDA